MPTEKPLPMFTVELSVARQWGTEQQQSIDSILLWSKRLSPEEGLKLLGAITALVNEILPGAVAPISESGSRTLDVLGYRKQLDLMRKPDA